jgi:leukotriene-A4 hydrolase
MNEGFTVFVERKIIDKVYGRARAGLKATLGCQTLNDTVCQLCKDGMERYTSLLIDHTDTDPDDTFSSIPYVKGFEAYYKLLSFKQVQGSY